MSSTKAIKIDTTDPSAYTELDPDHYHLLDELTYETLGYVSKFVINTLDYITEHYKNQLFALKPYHWITEESPIGRYYLGEIAEFKKVFYAKHPEYTLRWALPTWHADKGNLSAMHYTYPNWNGELKDLPAGMHGLKDFFRQGKACYSAEKLAEIARPAFNKKPNLLLNHYKEQSGEHVVLAGETLSKLCLKFYGDIKYWPSLLEINAKLNPGTVKDNNPKLLQIGKPLHIPTFSEIDEKFKIVGPPPNPRVEKQQKKKQDSQQRGLVAATAPENTIEMPYFHRFLSNVGAPIVSPPAPKDASKFSADEYQAYFDAYRKKYLYFVKEYFTNNWGYYVTQKGDTLGQLSELFYQTDKFWIILEQQNYQKGSFQINTKLPEGVKLYIASLSEAEEYFRWVTNDLDKSVYISTDAGMDREQALNYFNELIINEKKIQFLLKQIYEDRSSKRFYFPLETGDGYFEQLGRDIIDKTIQYKQNDMKKQEGMHPENFEFMKLIYNHGKGKDSTPFRFNSKSKLAKLILNSSGLNNNLEIIFSKVNDKNISPEEKRGSFRFSAIREPALYYTFANIKWSFCDPISKKSGKQEGKSHIIYLYDIFDFQSANRPFMAERATDLGRFSDYTNFMTIVEVPIQLP